MSAVPALAARPRALDAGTTRFSRARRFTAGVAAAAALASGIAFAFFLDGRGYAGNTATSSEIVLETSLGTPLSYERLYPTSTVERGEGRSQTFTITNDNPVDVTYVLAAGDDSATAAARQQFDELYAVLSRGNTVLYEGLLKDFFTETAIELEAASGEETFALELFLLETGAEQAQDTTTTFTISVDAKTTPDDRASELDA